MEGVAVKLIIKAPNQQIKDQIVKCDVGWTIGRLKEYLSEVYPSKPESSSQKLIYSGQLLNDSTYLKDALRQCDEQQDKTYTVHLVCAPQKPSANKMTPEKVAESSGTFTARTTMENTRLNNSNNIQSQSQDNNNNITQHTQFYPLQQQFAPMNNQQVTWMQQAYVNYITQYIQLMAAQGIQLQTNIPQVQQLNTEAPDSVQNSYAGNTNSNNVEEQSQPAEAAEANVAENNVAEEDDEFNQDWLDMFYMLSRSIVLFSMIYFYSPPRRLFMGILLGFAMYLVHLLFHRYRGGFLRVQMLLENNNDRVDNNNQVVRNVAAGAEQQQNGQGQSGQAEGRTNVNEGNEEERPGALTFTWTFFSSFFASLIPDQPNVI